MSDQNEKREVDVTIGIPAMYEDVDRLKGELQESLARLEKMTSVLSGVNQSGEPKPEDPNYYIDDTGIIGELRSRIKDVYNLSRQIRHQRENLEYYLFNRLLDTAYEEVVFDGEKRGDAVLKEAEIRHQEMHKANKG